MVVPYVLFQFASQRKALLAFGAGQRFVAAKVLFQVVLLREPFVALVTGEWFHAGVLGLVPIKVAPVGECFVTV